MAISKLEQLKRYTAVVADTGDFRLLGELQPQDCTTNPSLILKAVTTHDFEPLLDDAVAKVRHIPDDGKVDGIAEQLAVMIGVEALKLIPGRISTEVDASLSFDTAGTVAAAKRMIRLYEEAGVDPARVLVKIAATWEGIEACRVLEGEGINTNITLVFHLVQAVAAARAGAWLISPFVGRILDWHRKNEDRSYEPEEDPGVASVRTIYHYFRQHNYRTVVMAASFRNQGEIEALAGCDRMTIAPALLSALAEDRGRLEPRLPLPDAEPVPELEAGEGAFRWWMNESAMATEKLAEGIRLFNQDTQKLKAFIRRKLELQSAS